MSLSYVRNNLYRYQNVPQNNIIYRSGTKGYATIEPSQGVLMSYNNMYEFGIPTAAELVENYTGNSIIMTSNNKLVQVPVEGTSANKLLRNIDGEWKIVDFSIEYISPELYDPSSWQLWITDENINVINIPKNDMLTEYYGVTYYQDKFTLFKLTDFTLFVNEIYTPYVNSSTAFTDVYTRAKFYSGPNSNDANLYTCIFSSDRNKIFDGIIADYISNSTTIMSGSLAEAVLSVLVYGGVLIKNYNEHTSNTTCVNMITDGITTRFYSDTGLRNIAQCIKINDNTVIMPIEFVFNTRSSNNNGITFTNPVELYVMFLTDGEDTSEYYWYYPRNYINFYIRNRINE